MSIIPRATYIDGATSLTDERSRIAPLRWAGTEVRSARRATPLRSVGRLLAVLCCLLGLLGAGANGLAAAELRLRNRCEVSGPVVTLGDVAEVLATSSTEAEQLQSVELFPAPLPGQTRYLDVRELQDVLLLRGVDLVALRMRGAARIAIERQSSATRPARLAATSGPRNLWEQRIASAIRDYVRRQRPGKPGPRVTVAMRDEQLEQLSKATGLAGVSGGRPPWNGSQQFQVALQREEGPLFLQVAAQVESVPPILVAARALPRGTIIQADDVRVVEADPAQVPRDACRSPEEVIGAEAVRAIPEGEVIGTHSVRPPILVRRGDAVTVFARTAGVQVRTVARARANAALCDLVALESALDGSVFMARVTGVREAEVLARAATGRRPSAVGDRMPTVPPTDFPTPLANRPLAARQVVNRPASIRRYGSSLPLQTAASSPQPAAGAEHQEGSGPTATGRKPLSTAYRE